MLLSLNTADAIAAVLRCYTSFGDLGNDGSFMLFSRPTLPISHTVRTHLHPFFLSYLMVNVYACSSPTPALAKTWTLSMETSTGGTQISRFVKFKDTNLSFRRLISPHFCQIQLLWYIQEHKTHSNRIQAQDQRFIWFIWRCCGSITSANFVSSNQPNYEPYPSLMRSCIPPSSAVTLRVSPFFPYRPIWPMLMIG